LSKKSPGAKIPCGFQKNKIVSIQVEYREIQIGRLIKSAGGRWNREKKVWELPYGEAIALGLDKRIINV